MPCQHLAQIQQLHLPVSDADVLRIICPVCGNIEVCAYTPLLPEQLAEAVGSETEAESRPSAAGAAVEPAATAQEDETLPPNSR